MPIDDKRIADAIVAHCWLEMNEWFLCHKVGYMVLSVNTQASQLALVADVVGDGVRIETSQSIILCFALCDQFVRTSTELTKKVARLPKLSILACKESQSRQATVQEYAAPRYLLNN